MTARRSSKVTSSNPRRAPRLRISSVKNPLSRAPTSPDATARIAVVLPTPGGPVIRSATAERHRHAPGRDQASARRMSAAGQATARLPASSLTISPTKPLPSPRSIMVSSRIGHSPGRRGSGEELASPALEVGVLHRDLVAPEGEDVAARDLDLHAVGGGSGEEPLGESTVARDEVSRVAEVHVGEALEHARETLAHRVLPHEAFAPRIRARRELKYAVVRHERHEVVHVVPVPAVAERFQIFGCDHGGALRARHDAAEGLARQATIFRARCMGACPHGGRMYGVATSCASGGGRCYFCDTSSRERGPVMGDSAPHASITAAAAFLLLLSLFVAGSMPTVAQEAKCPFEGRRPPLGEILKGPASQRPSLCKANLAGTNLAGADLSGADLSGANLKGSNLARANLKRSRLVGAELAGSHLGKANLNGTSLAGADLGGTNLAEADLAGADLTNVDLAGAALTGADLTGANLTGAKLNNANLESAKLNNANLSDANVTEAYLGSARLEAVNLSSVKGITCAQVRVARTDRGTKLPDGMKCN